MPTYIRVVDDQTGHEVDVDEQSLRPGMTPIPNYPTVSGPNARPRPPLYHTAKDGKAAGKPRTSAAAKPSADTATTSQPEGAEQQ